MDAAASSMAPFFDFVICFSLGPSASMPACLDASWPLNGLGGVAKRLHLYKCYIPLTLISRCLDYLEDIVKTQLKQYQRTSFLLFEYNSSVAMKFTVNRKSQLANLFKRA